MNPTVRAIRTAVAALILAVGFAGSLVAGPLEDGRAAYKRGDYATAMRLWRPLADQGDTVVQGILGHRYQEGQGVPQDYAAAANWYRKAADQGEFHAQAALGFLYYNGQGVPQDYVLSHMWLNLAAAAGWEPATMGRDTIAKIMTPAQIAEAQRLAREWKSSQK